jgi:hypothetical protein
MQNDDAPQVQDDARPEEIDNAPKEDGGKPDQVPLAVLDKQREEKRKAQQEAADLRNQVEALQREKDLMSLAIPTQEAQKEEPVIPNPDDYVDQAEYAKDLQTFLSNRDKTQLEVYREEAKKLLDQDRKEQAKTLEQREYESKYENDRKAMLEKADSLNAPDFLEAERNLYNSEDESKGVWTKGFYHYVMSGFDNSEQIIYALGNDPEKALELAQGIDQDPFRGGQAFINFAQQLAEKNPSDKPLPEPDEPITGSAGGVSQYESQLAKKREEMRTGKITTNQFFEWKRANQPRNVA